MRHLFLTTLIALLVITAYAEANAQDYRRGRRRQETPAPQPTPPNQNPETTEPDAPEVVEEAAEDVRERPSAPKLVTARIRIKPNKSKAPKDLVVRLKGRGIEHTPDKNGTVEFRVKPNQTVPIEITSKNYADKVMDLAMGTSSREMTVEIEKLGFFKRLFGKN